jgi:Uma2 family endonuclease
MSIAPFPSESPPPGDPIFRLTVDQYHDMIHKGILTDDDKVELLEGWLFPKMPKNPPHVAIVEVIAQLLRAMIPAGWYVRTENPITTESSEPEPDISVPRGNPMDYYDRHPKPRDLAMVVEVADTSIVRDRGIKQRVYARAKVPVYWIVDIAERRIEVRTEPSKSSRQPAYTKTELFSGRDSVPVIIDGREVGRISLASIFPHSSL